MLSTCINYCCVTMDHRDELTNLTHYYYYFSIYIYFQWLDLLPSTCLILGFDNCGHGFFDFVR
jgi:hypothetical protein